MCPGRLLILLLGCFFHLKCKQREGGALSDGIGTGGLLETGRELWGEVRSSSLVQILIQDGE